MKLISKKNLKRNAGILAAAAIFCGTALGNDIQPVFYSQAEAAAVTAKTSTTKSAQTAGAKSSTAKTTANVLSGVRLGHSSARDRVVFDLTAKPKAYNVVSSQDGKTLTVNLTGVEMPAVQPTVKSRLIKGIVISKTATGIKAVITLSEKGIFSINSMANPYRVFLDVTEEEKLTVTQPADGMTLSTYITHTSAGRLMGWFLDVDLTKLKLSIALGNGSIAGGRERVSRISDDLQAMAAINGGYFASDSSLIGATRIDGVTAGTVYYTRTSLGIMQDGTLRIAPVNYSGVVSINKHTWPVGGVDCERGADSAVVYNSYFGSTTGTNEYGKEYIVRNGKVTAMGVGNSPIPQDGYVISVHGSAMEAFKDAKVGDTAEFYEDYGVRLNDAPDILGAGPKLLTNGMVDVTADSEQFPSDIRVGRAPRTAIGITKEGHALLAVIDGRSEASVGVTLTELARYMKQFGAVEAMNLDGGGSSEMVLGGNILNNPSDGGERPVGSAIIVTKK